MLSCCPNTDLTNTRYVGFAFVTHLCVHCYSTILPAAPHLLQLVYPAPQGVHLHPLLANSAVQLSDGLLLLCAVALSLIT